MGLIYNLNIYFVWFNLIKKNIIYSQIISYCFFKIECFKFIERQLCFNNNFIDLNFINIPNNLDLLQKRSFLFLLGLSFFNIYTFFSRGFFVFKNDMYTSSYTKYFCLLVELSRLPKNLYFWSLITNNISKIGVQNFFLELLFFFNKEFFDLKFNLVFLEQLFIQLFTKTFTNFLNIDNYGCVITQNSFQFVNKLCNTCHQICDFFNNAGLNIFFFFKFFFFNYCLSTKFDLFVFLTKTSNLFLNFYDLDLFFRHSIF